jgi:plastocyanin
VHHRSPVAALAILCLVVAACGGSPATAPPATTQAPATTEGAGSTEPPAAGGATVSIVDNEFDPTSLSVSVGDTVTWTNDGQNPHTVTFSDGVDSDNLGPGTPFERTFDTAGEFPYACKIHGSMQATVTVTE